MCQCRDPRNATPAERAYMDWLDETYPDAPAGGIGLLLFKGDPIAFDVGCREWFDELSETDKENLGI